jgi:hypothetical protein
VTHTVTDLQIRGESTQPGNTVPRAQWPAGRPAAGYEHIFNAGGENRSKFIFTFSTAAVNVSSRQTVRHCGNHNNIPIFCRPRLHLKPALIAYASSELLTRVRFIYGFYGRELPGVSLYIFSSWNHLSFLSSLLFYLRNKIYFPLYVTAFSASWSQLHLLTLLKILCPLLQFSYVKFDADM